MRYLRYFLLYVLLVIWDFSGLMFRTWIILSWFLYKGSSSIIQFFQCCLSSVCFWSLYWEWTCFWNACYSHWSLCLFVFLCHDVWLPWHCSMPWNQVLWCFRPIFFFNYLWSLVLNIKLGYSVKSIIDILVETALNL